MNEEYRSDIALLLPASVVVLVYLWVATDLSLLSTVVTLVLSWVGFLGAGLVGLRLVRRYGARPA